MYLHYLVKHEIAICGTWKRYFCNFGDFNVSVPRDNIWNSGLQIPKPESSRLQDYVGWCRISSTRSQYMMSTNWSSVWSPSGPTWSRAWSTRLLMNGAQGSRRAKGRHFEHLLCWTWALLLRLFNCVPKEHYSSLCSSIIKACLYLTWLMSLNCCFIVNF